MPRGTLHVGDYPPQARPGTAYIDTRNGQAFYFEPVYERWGTLGVSYPGREDGYSYYAFVDGTSEAYNEGAVAVGLDCRANAYSTAFGMNANANGESSIAIGQGARTTFDTWDAVAIGHDAQAYYSRAIAIGANARAERDDEAVISADSLRISPLTAGASALVLSSPDGSRWQITVDDTGTLSAAPAV